MVVVLAMGAGLWFATRPAPAQTPAAAYKAPRTKDGKADLNGIWQANNEANWDVEPHSAAQGPDLSLVRRSRFRRALVWWTAASCRTSRPRRRKRRRTSRTG